MKIKIKKKIRIKIKPHLPESVEPEVFKPEIPSWRNMTNEQKAKTYFLFKFMVCWDCGKRTDDARLMSRMIDDSLMAVCICRTCHFESTLKKQEAADMKIKVKEKSEKKSGTEKVKESKSTGGKREKGKSGLVLKNTWCLGLVRGLRKSKLVSFMEKEFPNSKEKFADKVDGVTSHFESGAWDDRKKSLPKELLK